MHALADGEKEKISTMQHFLTHNIDRGLNFYLDMLFVEMHFQNCTRMFTEDFGLLINLFGLKVEK